MIFQRVVSAVYRRTIRWWWIGHAGDTVASLLFIGRFARLFVGALSPAGRVHHNRLAIVVPAFGRPLVDVK